MIVYKEMHQVHRLNIELQAPDRRKMGWHMLFVHTSHTGFVEQVYLTKYSASRYMNCHTPVEEGIDDWYQLHNLHLSFIEQDCTSIRGSLTV